MHARFTWRRERTEADACVCEYMRELRKAEGKKDKKKHLGKVCLLSDGRQKWSSHQYHTVKILCLLVI